MPYGRKKVFVVGYHQSAFGKLGAMTVSEMLANAAEGAAADAGITLASVDVASVSGLLTPILNEQTLLSGLVAMIPGMGGKSIETVENACASGGQAILSVLYKLMLGQGDVGVAIGIEKMRTDDGKMDGKLIASALGTASHPENRPGKVFIFPHLFAEVMDLYMKEWGVSEEELAHVPVTMYRHANLNPYAHMQNVQMTVDKVMTIDGPNRYVVDGLPLKTFECSQISDGFAGIILATEAGIEKLGIPREKVVELAGFGQITDPLSVTGRDVIRPAGAYKAVNAAYDMAGIHAESIDVAEVHDCFGIMGALSVEILGLVDPGKGAGYFVDGKARVDGGGVPINTSGGLIAKGHPVGATGVAMVGWNYRQLTGAVPAGLQVKNPGYAASFNIGGPICSSVCIVLKAPS
jgi:acetyl-CoA C-acetyltransferase